MSEQGQSISMALPDGHTFLSSEPSGHLVQCPTCQGVIVVDSVCSYRLDGTRYDCDCAMVYEDDDDRVTCFCERTGEQDVALLAAIEAFMDGHRDEAPTTPAPSCGPQEDRSRTVNPEDRIAIGITGSRDLSDEEADFVRATLARTVTAFRPEAVRLIVGCCVGVDACAGRWAKDNGIMVHGVLPPDRSRVAADWRDWCDTWEELPSGPDGYKRRNQRLVDLADALKGFPRYAERDEQSRRSGTWQTIRMGWRKDAMFTDGCITDVYVLSACLAAVA